MEYLSIKQIEILFRNQMWAAALWIDRNVSFTSRKANIIID